MDLTGLNHKAKRQPKNLETDLQLIKSNNNKTEQEATEQIELEYIISKTNKRIKEKRDNKISFAHFKPAKNGRGRIN